MKKILSLLLIFTITGISAYAAPLYSRINEEIVTDGVMLKSIQRFYGDYALNINCITADLKNKNLGFELLKHSGGSDKLETVINMAKGEENTVAAINGDFFSRYKDDQNFSLGLEIKDGTLLQSHINSNMAAGFVKDNALTFSYIDFKGSVTSPDGTRMPLAHINKPTDYYGALLMYTPEYNGSVSPFLPEGITAVTVTENTVTAKGISLGGTIPIPENGYILAIDDNMTPFLEYKFNIGDKVETEIEATPTLGDIETAFGGGTLLLKDGKKTEITHNVSGNNPRSVIGTNSDGTVIYMITVDGRQAESRGVSLDVLADICIEMGCENAINLDGGGSTAMVGATLEKGELHYINSPTENRKVINALAITSTAEREAAVGFKGKAMQEKVLSGESVELKAIPYDKNYNPPSSCSTEPRWVVAKGGGYVKNNIYYASGDGETVLDLYFGKKKTDSVTITVTKKAWGEEGDPMEKPVEGGFSFDVYATGDMDTLFERLVYAKAAKSIGKADASAVVGEETFDILSGGTTPLTAEKWAEHNYENVKVISIETAGGVISRGGQWQKLLAALGGAKQKNIIILLNSAPKFVADIDKAAFDEMTEKASKDKNIFLVYRGEENSCRMENGVRYISLADVNNGENISEKIENICKLSFNITEKDISYQFEKLYDKTQNTDKNSGIVLE